MLKKISVDRLRRGMYLHELCGSWIENPFWRSGFVLADAREVERIVASGIKEAWIDTAKGCDVDLPPAPGSPPAPEASPPAPSPPGRRSDARVPIEEELKRAARIVTKAKQAVTEMFNEARMGKALDAADALPIVDEISGSVARHPGAIINIARLKTKDEYTYMHSVAVCAMMVALARQLGFDEQATRDAGLAGLLHDVGKMMMPDEVLNKPGKLTDDEFRIMMGHPEAGYTMLFEGQGITEIALDVCLHHHEKTDGSGYPHGLKDEQITIFAKMGAVCDVYDAITSNRPYKSGWDPGESIRRMTEWLPGHFDERVFHAFVKSLGIYPIGSLVRLHSGRLGIVVDQTEKSLLAPKVRVFFSTKANAHIPPELIDLSQPAARDKIVGSENPADWNFDNLDRLIGTVELWD